LVLDPFAGSGTTGRACINTKRNYIMLDINPKGREIFEESIKSN
jgi:DNA modification methylase